MVKTTELRVEKPRATKAFYCVPTVKSTGRDVVAYKCTFKGADTATFIKLLFQVKVRRARLRDSRVPEPGRADPGQGRDQRQHHQHPPRRGDEQGAERGDREEDRRQHQRLPAAAPGEQAEAEQAEADQRPVQASQTGSRITSRGPCDQIRPTLVATKPANSSGSSQMSSQSCSRPIRDSARSVSRLRVAVRRRAGRGSAPAAGAGRRSEANSPGWRATTSAPTFSGSPSEGR